MKKNTIVFEIAEIVFAITSDQHSAPIYMEKAYDGFFCGAKPDVMIHAHYGDVPRIPLRDCDRVFDSQMNWSLYHAEGKNIFVLRSPAAGPLPYSIAVFDSDFLQGEVFVRIPESVSFQDSLPNPLGYPLSEVLMICLLARGRGIMIHSCGIDDNGHGYLFAGNSTHGKTTIARLWKDEALVLNDDRIVIRRCGDNFRMFGTPFHGDYSGVSPNGLPLEKIFFLFHADAHESRCLSNLKATSMILTRCFPPLWNAKEMAFTLDFCTQLTHAVPCYALGFRPDESVIDFVRCVK